MPREFDYTQGNETDWNEVRLPKLDYGRNEITEDEQGELSMAVYPTPASFWPQFSTYTKRDPKNRALAMDGAHAWLTASARARWFLSP